MILRLKKRWSIHKLVGNWLSRCSVVVYGGLWLWTWCYGSPACMSSFVGQSNNCTIDFFTCAITYERQDIVFILFSQFSLSKLLSCFSEYYYDFSLGQLIDEAFDRHVRVHQFRAYTVIQCTHLLVEKAGVTPVVTFRITAHKQERVQARYPLWIWNPWGRTHKVQNRSNQWLHKMDLGPNKKFKKKKEFTSFSFSWDFSHLLYDEYH